MTLSSTTSGSNAWATDRALAALAFLVTVTVWPGISGFALAPRWAVLAVGVSAAMFACNNVVTPAHWLGIAFLGYAVLSLAWAPVLVEAMQGLAQWIILAGAFCLGTRLSDTRPFYIALALGMAVSGLIAVFQYNGIPVLEQTAPPGGLFANKNFMGEAAALALVGGIAIGLPWLLLAGSATALVLSSCWGACLGVVLAGVVKAWSMHWALGIFAILTVLFCAHVAFIKLDGKRTDLIIRGKVWMDAADNMKWAGHGVGQYWVTTPEKAPRQEVMNVRHWHAHNDPLELLYEFGVGALPLFVLVALCLAWADAPERYVLVTFIGVGMVGFPLFMPATGFVGAVVAGRAVGRRFNLLKPVAERASHRIRWNAWAWSV